VVINAGAPAGGFYAAQTLRLLLPPETLRKAPVHDVPAALELPAMKIEDAPRYAWRGVHLDVARHFFPKAWILRLIDLAALHKLNVLHLHLTDEQGWRFPVRRTRCSPRSDPGGSKAPSGWPGRSGSTGPRTAATTRSPT
jgi:hexosaminidase